MNGICAGPTRKSRPLQTWKRGLPCPSAATACQAQSLHICLPSLYANRCGFLPDGWFETLPANQGRRGEKREYGSTRLEGAGKPRTFGAQKNIRKVHTPSYKFLHFVLIFARSSGRPFRSCILWKPVLFPCPVRFVRCSTTTQIAELVALS